MDRRCSLAGRLLGPFCCGLFLLLLLVLEGSVVFQTCAMDIEVKDDDNITCLVAKWMMNFSVSYESNANENKEAYFTFPSDLRYDGSTCGNETYGPVLSIQFGEGNSWTIIFEKMEDSYQGRITFIYNTDDENLFPDAKKLGLMTTSVNYPDHTVPLNTAFCCQSTGTVVADNVIQTFWNVTLQAYTANNAISEMVTLCHDDKIAAVAAAAASVAAAMTTTAPGTIVVVAETATVARAVQVATAKTSVKPTTAVAGSTTVHATSAVTTTNATTANVTTAPPRPLPTVTPGEKPTTGNYSVKINGTTCLLANMGLQLNITHETEGLVIVNINPGATEVSGNCSNKTAVLHLNDANTTMIEFIFAITEENIGKFYLKEVNITVLDPFHKTNMKADNNSLDHWKAFLGSSYMCQREQTLVLSRTFSIKTYDVWVQPFLVTGNAFATAEDCHVAVDNYFVPIFVGMALAGLVVLVLMAYFVGRKNRHFTGYEQF